MSKELNEFLAKHGLNTLYDKLADGRTVLHLLAKDNNVALLTEVIAAGLDVNAVDLKGKTPLLNAIEPDLAAAQKAIEPDLATVTLLLSHDAKIYIDLNKENQKLIKNCINNIKDKHNKIEIATAKVTASINDLINTLKAQALATSPLMKANAMMMLPVLTPGISFTEQSRQEIVKIMQQRLQGEASQTSSVLKSRAIYNEVGKAIDTVIGDLSAGLAAIKIDDLSATAKSRYLLQCVIVTKTAWQQSFTYLKRYLAHQGDTAILLFTQPIKEIDSIIQKQLEQAAKALSPLLDDFEKDFQKFFIKDNQFQCGREQLIVYWNTIDAYCQRLTSTYEQCKDSIRDSAGDRESLKTLLLSLDKEHVMYQNFIQTNLTKTKTMFMEDKDLSQVTCFLSINHMDAVKQSVDIISTFVRMDIDTRLSAIQCFLPFQNHLPFHFQSSTVQQYLAKMEPCIPVFEDSFRRAKRSEREHTQMRREQEADARKTEAKQKDEKKHLAELAKIKAQEIKQHQANMLASIQKLKGQNHQLFDSILSGTQNLHGKIESSDFIKLISYLSPFRMDNTKQGALLHFADTPLDGLHREHHKKEGMDGAVIRAFKAKLLDLGITAATLPALLKEKPKP